MEEVEFGQPELILKDGRPVAIVAVAPEAAEQVRRDLEASGYRVQEPARTADGKEAFELGGECEMERPRTCEIEITLGTVAEAAEAAGVSTAEIDALAERPFTEDEAEQAARAVLARIPEDVEGRQEAAGFVEACFTNEDGSRRRG